MAAKKKAKRGARKRRSEPSRTSSGASESGSEVPSRAKFKPKGAPRRTARTCKPEDARKKEYTGEQRMLLLDTWLRSELSAGDFSTLVGVSKHTLYIWKRNFERSGPAGLMGHRKVHRGSRMPEVTRRAILLMKKMNPEWGRDRLHDMLLRSKDLQASSDAIGRVLKAAGYGVEAIRTKPNRPKVKRFVRSKPNEMWQTDLFSFILKRQRRRVHLVAYMDDFSRFIVGFGLHASASGALVREVFEQAIANYGAGKDDSEDTAG